MPFLDEIVSRLNNQWINSSLKFITAPKIKAYGIAEPVIEPIETEQGPATKRYPATVDNDGEASMIVPDDNYHLIMYHRVEGITNAVAPKTGFGDTPGDQLETANMSLVVMAFRDKVRKPAHWLEASLKDGIDYTSKLKDASGNYMQTSVFRVGNSSLDKLQLLGREYSDVELNYINLIVFEIKYRIESTWKKGCFIKNCNC